MPYREKSAFGDEFLDTVRQWFAESEDIFVVARFSATAGAREYYWLRSFDTFREQLDRFPKQTDVTVFRENRFPLRGIVDDAFIRQTLDLIPDNTEAMVTNGVIPPDTHIYVWACDTHADLLETLQDLPGEPVSVGFYAPWHEADNENMVSALIPMPDGTIKRGIY